MSSAPTKVAVITGASQGIGAALVHAYRQRGYGVVATSRSITPSDDDSGVLAIPGDISNPATSENLVAQGLWRFGRIATLINNARTFLAEPFADYTAREYDAIVGVNLTGLFRLTQRAIAAMLDTGGGHVVNITTGLVTHANSGALGACVIDQGRHRRRTPLSRHRVRRPRHTSQRRLSRHSRYPMHAHQDPQVLGAMHPMGRMAKSRTSRLPSSTWKTLPS